MVIIIESVNGLFRAKCAYSDDEAEMTVVFSKKDRVWMDIYTTTFSGQPYHVIRDKIHELINKLESDPVEAL